MNTEHRPQSTGLVILPKARILTHSAYTPQKDEKLHIIQMNRQPSDELKKTMAETGYSWLESRKQFFCRLDGADIAQASAVLESSGFQRDDTSIDRLMNENNLSKHKDRNSSLTFSM